MNNIESLAQTPETPVEEGAAPRSSDWENPRVAAILAAAAKCFARKGFSATTLAEIGKELGLRKSRSAARRDEELKRRASALQREAEQLIFEGVQGDLRALAPDANRREALSTLILAVLNGLSISQYLDNDESRARAAYDLFLDLLQSELKDLPSA
jgi:AcrR family transcriptional regulator